MKINLSKQKQLFSKWNYHSIKLSKSLSIEICRHNNNSLKKIKKKKNCIIQKQ